jgi:polyisoprenoid-binding protein YceI
MKYLPIISVTLVAFLATAFTINEVTQWKVKEDYTITFETKKAKGSFDSFTGLIFFDENNLDNSSCNLKIEVASIKTGNFLKNKHARGTSWFDAENHPMIQFISSSINKTSFGFEAVGVLEMRGIKQEITIPFSFTNDVFESSFVVDRTDYSVGGIRGLQGKVGREVILEISIPVIK